MDLAAPFDRPSILGYLHDPELSPDLIQTFFRAALDYADARPWARLQPMSHFPILLHYYQLDPPLRRLAMILGGEQSGGDALGLVLVEDLPGDPEGEGLSHPALTVLYAGYPDDDLQPIRWRGEPLPRSRAGLLPWPTVHDVNDRVRAPRRQELMVMTCGLLAVRRFLQTYPEEALDDATAVPHRCDVAAEGLPGTTRVVASTFALMD